jgi:hypothetical protein
LTCHGEAQATGDSSRSASVMRDAYRVTSHGPLVNGYSRQGEWLYPPPNSPIEYRKEPLEGQEFLRLAGCITSDRAEAFVRAYGNTGLVSVVEQWIPPAGPGGWKDVDLLLALAPATAGSNAQRWEDAIPDVVRQALLMRAVVDAYRLAGQPRKLGARVRSWEKRGWTNLEEEPVLGPLARAGIGFDPRREERGRRRRLLFFRFPPDVVFTWKSRLSLLGGPHPQPRGLFLTTEGLMRFVGGVLQPAVELVARSVIVREGRLELVSHLGFQPAMVTVCHLQAAEAFARRAEIHECGWARCPGAPERQGLFLFKTQRTGTREGGEWAWKDSPSQRQRYRGDDYCSRECASAASSHQQRQRNREWSDTDRWRRNERRRGN